MSLTGDDVSDIVCPRSRMYPKPFAPDALVLV